MPISCAAFNCTTRKRRGDGVSFHRFPFGNKLLLKNWILALKRKNFIPTHNHRICSKHFTDNSFEPGRYQSSPKLKWNAVPTIFDFSVHPKGSVEYVFQPTHYLFPVTSSVSNNEKEELKNTFESVGKTEVASETIDSELSEEETLHINDTSNINSQRGVSATSEKVKEEVETETNTSEFSSIDAHISDSETFEAANNVVDENIAEVNIENKGNEEKSQTSCLTTTPYVICIRKIPNF